MRNAFTPPPAFAIAFPRTICTPGYVMYLVKLLTDKIKNCIFAPLLFLPHVGAAKEILLNAVPLTMPQHLMRHYCFMETHVGSIYKHLTVIDRNEVKGGIRLKLRCICGAEFSMKNSEFKQKDRASCGCKRYLPLNKHAFDELTPEALYWLGFLAADGNIYGSNVSISLKQSDRDHLVKFKEFLGSGHKLSENSTHNGGCCVKIPSPYIVDRLKSLWIGERKTMDYTVHPLLVESRDFWRGMIDGDGHISSKRNVLSMCGTSDTITNYVKFVYSNTGVLPRIHKQSGIYYAIRNSKYDIKKILDLLYGGDPKYYMDRKMQSYNDFVSKYEW